VAHTVADDLEILTVGEDTTPWFTPVAPVRPEARPTAITRRRFLALLATVTVLAGLVFPVRGQLAANELRRLWRDWLMAQAYDTSRAEPAGRLFALGFPGDRERLARATAALDDEEAAALARLARRLGGWHAPDRGVGRLRQLLRTALAGEVTDLGADAAGLRRTLSFPSAVFSTATVLARDKVDTQLAIEQRRFRLAAPRAPVAAPMHSADQELIALSRFLDEPTAARLALFNEAPSLEIIDIDRSQRFMTPPVAVSGLGAVLAREGYLAYQLQDGSVWAGPLDFLGPPRLLVPAGSLVAAARPDAIWSQTAAGAIEVDGQGLRLAGPVPLPANATLVGASGVALLSEGAQGSLWLTTLDQRVARQVAAQGVLVAAEGSVVAWVAGDTPTRLFVSRDGGLTASLINGPDGYQPDGVGALSPGGDQLAASWSRRLGLQDFAVGVTNVERGGTQLFPSGGDGEYVSHMEWSTSGDRLFLARALPIRELWTWHAGDSQPRQVRVSPNTNGSGLVVLPAAGS
jgi:hypothetical protein